MRIFVLMTSLIIISCCVQNDVPSELVIKIDANPDTIFASGKTRLSMDVMNNGNKTLKYIELDFFETGLLEKSDCSKTLSELKPDGFETFSCEMVAPKEISSNKLNRIEALAIYRTTLSATKVVRVLSHKEYDLGRKTGELEMEPKTYSFKDENIELEMEFSNELPLIEDRREYVYFTIRNIGNGFIDSLRPGDFKLESKLFGCSQDTEIFPIGKTFPRIACEINTPESINYLSDYMLIITINYKYEVRDSINIKIIR